MTLQSPQATDGEILALIKELSGKLIERRRRREHVSQQFLAKLSGAAKDGCAKSKAVSPHRSLKTMSAALMRCG
jgi:DNA-binding transcriptional regulator YiaG